MPTDIAIHPMGNPIQGNHPVQPVLPLLAGGQISLAEETISPDIVVPLGGAVLVLQATAKLRVAIQAAVINANNPAPGFVGVAAPNAAASPIVLNADQPRPFALASGRYRISTSVYA